MLTIKGIYKSIKELLLFQIEDEILEVKEVKIPTHEQYEYGQTQAAYAGREQRQSSENKTQNQ